MKAYLFTILLFAFLQNTHQVLLRIQTKDDKSNEASLRSLELDTDTSFPMIEAVKIQLGEWSFWLTVILFAGVVFMAWKEKYLGKWERIGAYAIFVGLIFFSYLAIPFILGFGAYCFRSQITQMFQKQNSIPSLHFPEKGKEMTEFLIPKEKLKAERNLQSNNIPLEGFDEEKTFIYPNVPLQKKYYPHSFGETPKTKGFFERLFKKLSSKTQEKLKTKFNTATRGIGQKAQNAFVTATESSAQYLINQINPSKAADPMREKERELALPKPLESKEQLKDGIDYNSAITDDRFISAKKWDEVFERENPTFASK